MHGASMSHTSNLDRSNRTPYLRMLKASIIVPAHNEANVIRATLEGLLRGLDGVDAQVIVVCNGCSDNSAEIARLVDDPRIQVAELAIGSKPGALNEGDRLAEYYPRVYMDADVQISGQDMVKFIELMEEAAVPAAAPKAEMVFSGSSWAVRAYYKVWFSLPYVRNGMVGCGVYALSKLGRSRFGTFPEIISDDGFVRAHFSDDERPVINECIVKVNAPRTLSGLVKIFTRSRLGGKQLQARYPELFGKELANPRWRALAGCFSRPRLWHVMPVYLLVVLLSLWRSRVQFKNKQFDIWERDDTSRQSI